MSTFCETESRVGVAARRFLALSILIVMGAGVGGCQERERGPEVVTLEGKIDDIKATGNGSADITVSYYSEKHKQDIVGTARVNKDTEIMINGAAADLSQLKEGERIRGDVLVERVDGDKRYTVKKIFIDRAAPPPTSGG